MKQVNRLLIFYLCTFVTLVQTTHVLANLKLPIHEWYSHARIIFGLKKHTPENQIKKSSAMAIQANPQDVIFAWDLHDVLTHRNKSKIIKKIYAYPRKTAFLTSPSLLAKTIAMLVTDITGQAIIQHVVDHARALGHPEYAQLMIDVENAQKPNTAVIELLEELNAKGYRNHHLVSNISKDSFEQFTNKNIHPEFEHLFKCIDLKKSMFVSKNHYPAFIQKPNPQFFKNYFTVAQIDPTQQPVIFIDDNKRNVIKASELGMIGVLYQSPGQLREALFDIGVPLAKSADQKFGKDL